MRTSRSEIKDGRQKSGIVDPREDLGPRRTRFNDVFYKEIPAFPVPIVWIKSSIRWLRPQFLSLTLLFLPFGPKCPVTHSRPPLFLLMKSVNCSVRRRSSRVRSDTTSETINLDSWTLEASVVLTTFDSRRSFLVDFSLPNSPGMNRITVVPARPQQPACIYLYR